MSAPPDAVVFAKGERTVTSGNCEVVFSIPRDITLEEFTAAFAPLVMEAHRALSRETLGEQ